GERSCCAAEATRRAVPCRGRPVPAACPPSPSGGGRPRTGDPPCAPAVQERGPVRDTVALFRTPMNGGPGGHELPAARPARPRRRRDATRRPPPRGGRPRRAARRALALADRRRAQGPG